MASTTGRRRGRAGWQRLIARQERDTLSQQGFCEREGVALSTFQYWRRRLREESEEVLEAGSATERFVAVELQPQPASAQSNPIRIHLPSGVGIEVEPGFDPVTLREVLEVFGVAA